LTPDVPAQGEAPPEPGLPLLASPDNVTPQNSGSDYLIISGRANKILKFSGSRIFYHLTAIAAHIVVARPTDLKG
jgi:hypothetical protein